MNLYHILLIFKGIFNLRRHKKEESSWEQEWEMRKRKEIEQWKRDN
jgi:hypothetical protein